MNDSLLQWFGDSRVRNALGFPKIQYHSTAAVFSVFDTCRSELGTHVGSIAQANSFGSYQRGGSGRFIMPLYVRLENPLRLQDAGEFSPTEIACQLGDLDIIDRAIVRKVFDDMDYCIEENRSQLIVYWISVLQDAVIQAGFDGIVYLNRREGLSVAGKFIDGEETNDWSDDYFQTHYPEAKDSYIVFDPAHIKSAVSNNGQYRLDRESIFE